MPLEGSLRMLMTYFADRPGAARWPLVLLHRRRGECSLPVRQEPGHGPARSWPLYGLFVPAVPTHAAGELQAHSACAFLLQHLQGGAPATSVPPRGKDRLAALVPGRYAPALASGIPAHVGSVVHP